MKALTPKQEAFAVAVAKGMTGADAYRSAYEPKKMTDKTLHETASRLMNDRKVAARIAQLRAPALRRHELSVENVIREVARVSMSDLRRLLDDNGNVLPPSQWDDDIAAAVSSVEFDKDTGRISKVRLWEKNASLGLAARHLGLFERDNAQRRESLAIQVNLIGQPPEPPAGTPHSKSISATLVEPGKVNGGH